MCEWSIVGFTAHTLRVGFVTINVAQILHWFASIFGPSAISYKRRGLLHIFSMTDSVCCPHKKIFIHVLIFSILHSST
jgi:hypothetical protein